MFWTIITTVLVIHFIRCSFFSLLNSPDEHFFIYFSLLPGGLLLEGNLLDYHNYRTCHSIHLIGCLFSLLSNSLDEHFLFIFFLTSSRGFIGRIIFGQS